MKPPRLQTDIIACRATTATLQASAADPEASVWVNANAGTGKTHVLTMRVLRLLLAGTPPERILCLTYTKAAAAEMSKRVFDRLAKWVTASDGDLKADVANILPGGASSEQLAFARTLFTKAIETPGGLKVQTIHAFCERLLQRFPLEASVAPGFKILDDAGAAELISRAIEQTLAEATATTESPLGRALAVAVRFASDHTFDDLLKAAIAERAWLLGSDRARIATDPPTDVEPMLRQTLRLSPGDTRDGVADALDNVLRRDEIVALRDHARTGSASDQTHAAHLDACLNAPSRDGRIACLAKYFLNGDGDPRSGLMTKALCNARPDLHALSIKAQGSFCRLNERRIAVLLLETAIALHTLADAVQARYTSAKATAGALDFEDLIEKTSALLGDGSGAGAPDWVLYKLDGGLDHILVDEAQDTNPAQWGIITALVGEFFSGAGARDVTRTVFAVGDEKQSIYSFQGARPEMFAATGQNFRTLAASAAMAWNEVPLTLSFRTVQPLLDAVDRVFEDASRTPGLTASGAAPEHAAHRFGHAGLIELWPTERPDGTTPADAWQPLADTSERAPANRLAERIADTIKSWLDNGERLACEDRPIRPGDILILVRKRNPFAVPMVAALKKRAIPVAGADRIRLTDQIAVQDMMALGEFLTLPEDDLALATVLKSPLFGFDDDDLFAVAYRRKGALWSALLAHGEHDRRFADAAATLKRWRDSADFTPPYEFYAALLDRDGGRTRMLERLGAEAIDALDEFLDLALAYDDRAPPSLTGFLAHLRAIDHEVKRDMEPGRDEVRVMTVHGAKGLEAPIVFLPDTCTTTNGRRPGATLRRIENVTRPKGAPAPILWQVPGTKKHETITGAQAAERRQELHERNRLLYVAMTRARDRLYVAGFEGKNAPPSDCWYRLIADAVSPHMQEVVGPEDRKILRYESAQHAPPEKTKAAAQAAIAAIQPPDFARRQASAEPRLSVPLQPSRLAPYDTDSETEPPAASSPTPDPAVARDTPSPLAPGGPDRFLRGTITHALLQHLPAIAAEDRAHVAQAFIERRGARLPARVRAGILKETLAVLDDATFAPIFTATSRAEVPISATLPAADGQRTLDLSGQIDRLAVTATEVLVVDYKTNRPPPLAVADVAEAYLLQLAAYTLALREIYPGRTIRAALLWTDGPRLMEIPPDVLNRNVERLGLLGAAAARPKP